MGVIPKGMPDDSRISRRKVISTVGAVGALGLAGCSGGDGGDGGDGGSGSDGGSDGGDGGSSGGSGGSGGSQSYTYTLGTSGESTGTHGVGVAFSSVMDEFSDILTINPQTTPGTTANPRLMDQGQIDIGQSTDLNGWRGNTGQAPYTGDGALDITLCQSLAWMTVDIVMFKRDTEEFSDIETVNDIPSDVPMTWGPPGASGYSVAQIGFEMAGAGGPSDYNLRNMEFGDIATAMREGRIDIAMSLTVNRDTLLGYVQELDSTSDIDIVQWPWSQEEAEEHPSPLSPGAISADLFSSDLSVDEFQGLSTGYSTYFTPDHPAEATYEFAKVLLENNEEVQQYHSAVSGFDADFAVDWLASGPEVPVHPGVEQYLKEEDLWEDRLISLDDYESN